MWLWLVERDVDDRGLLRLVYASTDGSKYVRREHAPTQIDTITAAIDVPPDRLEPVDDDATSKRYATEAVRMEDHHDPSDSV